MFQESLLTDPDVDDLREDLEEKDHQFAEKQKTLEQYNRERTMLRLSCKDSRKSFLKISQELKDGVSEVKRLKEEKEKNHSEISTMEVFQDLLEKEVEALEDELGGASYFTARSVTVKIQERQTQLQKIEEMTSSRETCLLELTEKLKSTEGALRGLKNQALQLKEKWFQEGSQIVSKSHQIHQLKRVIDQLRGRIAMKARAIDQLLQQRMAARNKPQRPVFQVIMRHLEPCPYMYV